MEGNASLIRGDALYETLFDQAPVGIVVQGRDGRIVRANQAFCDMFGYSRDEVIGFDLDEIVAGDADCRSEAREISGKVIGGESLSLETERIRRDGMRFPVSIKGVPVKEEEKVVGVYVIYEDISDRKETEDLLRRERTQFERIMLDSPDGIAIFDSSGRILRTNPAFENLFGLDAGEAVGRYLCDVAGGEDSAEEVCLNIERLKMGQDVDHESARKRKNGTKVHVSVRGASISPNGEPSEFLAIYRDVSDRKWAEEALATERGYFENLFVNCPEAVALVDSSGVIQRINRSFEELFGYRKQECTGKLLDELIAPGEMGEDAAELTRDAAEGGRVKVERTRRKKDGTWINVQIIAVSFTGIAGQTVVYAIYQDITERKLFEEHARYMGYHDGLTGLYNQAFIEEEIQRLDTPRQLPISVVMVDLDNLKLVNDAFGHLEGDKLILEAGNILRSCCRREDIVARCGGDEFLLLLPETPLQDARTICDRIRQGCECQSGSLISLILAIGVASKEDVTQDFMHVLKKADDDMYLDKLLRSEKSRAAIFRRLEIFLEFDHRRKAHIERLMGLACRFGEFLSMRKDEIANLELLARFHDVGLMPVPADILYRAEPLEIEEMEMIRKHPERGYHIAKNLPDITPVAECILSHQETFDGKGYPRGLSGEDIPLPARIIHLLCAYEVMTGWRSYAPVLSKEEALKEIASHAGSQFDPRLVGLFVKMQSSA